MEEEDGPSNAELAQSIVIAREWQTFARGHWTEEMPAEPGLYPVATKHGYQAAPIELYTKCDVPSWVRWYWSEPYPTLPAPPEK